MAPPLLKARAVLHSLEINTLSHDHSTCNKAAISVRVLHSHSSQILSERTALYKLRETAANKPPHFQTPTFHSLSKQQLVLSVLQFFFHLHARINFTYIIRAHSIFPLPFEVLCKSQAAVSQPAAAASDGCTSAVQAGTAPILVDRYSQRRN